jgi:hypothetical protein
MSPDKIKEIDEEQQDIVEDFITFLEWFNPKEEQDELRQSNSIWEGEEKAL